MGGIDWGTVLTGGSLVASLSFAAVLLVVLGAFFGVGWRTGVAVAVTVIGLNVFVPGGAPHFVFAALRPLHVLATSHPPAPVEEPPRRWPP
jgi:hypothetical protein